MNRLILSLGIACTTLQANAQTPTLIDISAGSTSSQPANFTVHNGKMYFYASDATHGRELWVKDGAGAPAMVADINAGANSSYSAAINQNAMTSLAGKLYFVANNGTNKGEELFQYSGSGTPSLAAEIEAGAQSSFIQQMTSLNGILYFRAQTAANGTELWKFDPVSGTTSRLTDINAGANSSDPAYITIYNNKLYFQANNGSKKGLWSFDPATGSVDSVALGTGFNAANTPQSLVASNGKLYMTATTFSRGRELYAYTGSGSATRLTNMNGNSDGFSGADMINFAGTLYMGANNGTTNVQLYKYNMSSTDTFASVVATINSTGSANLSSFFIYGSKLYFTADNSTAGAEMWKYDGTSAPAIVADIATGAAGSNPTGYTMYNYTMYFSADDGSTGKELYSFLDPSVQGINEVKLDGEIIAYPNPATADMNMSINLNTLQQFNIVITDVQGRELYTTGMNLYTPGNHIITIPAQSLAPGNYFYTATGKNGEKFAAGKIVKL